VLNYVDLTSSHFVFQATALSDTLDGCLTVFCFGIMCCYLSLVRYGILDRHQ
jgi:hypothetical protein